MKISPYWAGMLLTCASFGSLATDLSLSLAEQLALARDPKQHQFNHQAQGLREQGIAGSQLADPMVRLGLANLPTDSFSLTQDPMTQINIGVSQQFSRGDSRALTQEGFEQQALMVEEQAEIRQLEALQQVRVLWLQLQYTEVAQDLVLQNRQLFEPLLGYVQTQFELGMKQSQDVLMAELELHKFDEIAARYAQQEQSLRGQLARWLGEDAWRELGAELPEWPETRELADSQLSDLAQQYTLFKTHPMLVYAERQVTLADNRIELAEQSYKPAFKVELGYGNRQFKEPDGSTRADLLSGFVSMDVPLFTEKRQDRKLAAAHSGKGASLAERDALVYQMSGQLSQAMAAYQQSKMRMERYQQTVLPQARQRSESVLQGYQSNTASFDDVMRAQLDVQNLELEYHQLHFDNLAYLAQIRFFQGR